MIKVDSPCQSVIHQDTIESSSLSLSIERETLSRAVSDVAREGYESPVRLSKLTIHGLRGGIGIYLLQRLNTIY